MALFVPRWLCAKNSATPTDGTDRTDKAISVDSVGAEVRLKKMHEPTKPTPTDAVLAAARLLREHRWLNVPQVCAFLIGSAGERCQRCGAP